MLMLHVGTLRFAHPTDFSTHAPSCPALCRASTSWVSAEQRRG